MFLKKIYQPLLPNLVLFDFLMQKQSVLEENVFQTNIYRDWIKV